MTVGMQCRTGARLAATLATLLAGSTWLDAHEFWITVTPVHVAAGEAAPFVIGFAERFPAATALAEADAVSVRVFGPSGDPVSLRTPTQTTSEGLLAGAFPGGTEPGLYTLDASLSGKVLNYAASDFQAYLARERMSAALSFRRALKEEDRDAREIVTMFAKTFVQVGAARTEPRRLHTILELLPLDDPTTLRLGDTLRVRLFFNNGPFSNAPVTAINTQAVGAPLVLNAKTNAAGDIALTLTHPGLWLIRAAQMVPHGAPKGAPTEWESYWSSLTVTVPPR